MKNFDIKNLDISVLWKDFHTRQRLLIGVMVAAVLIGLFYWTDQIIGGMRAESAARVQITAERIVNVQKRILEINDKNANAKTLSTGLMSYVQGMGSRMKIPQKFVNIRMVGSQGRQEQVSFRTEALVYQELVLILRDFEQYDNVWVKSISFAKRFDNPKRMDVSWDVVRGAQ